MELRLSVDQQSVTKVCQLTGEWDRERGTPAYNWTESRFALFGTDLGSSFEHGGRLWFLFGDTWPTPVNPAAGLAAVSRSPKHMEVFAVAADGVIRGRWFWNGWKDWYALGGARFSQTAGIAAASRSSEHMELFAVGEDGVIRTRRFLNGWDESWSVLDGARFSQDAGIAAVSRGVHHMELFALGEDGVMRGRWFWDKWRDWYVLGDAGFAQTAGVAAVSRDEHHMEVFAVGTDGAVRGRWFWDGWQAWYALEGAHFDQAAGIAAVSRSPQHMELFAITRDWKVTGRFFINKWAQSWYGLETCSDSIAWTDATEVRDGIPLTFVNDGGVYRSPRVIENGAPLDTGCLNVPLSGFSANGEMYVFHSTGFKDDLMGRSVLCRANGGDPTDLSVLYTVSDVHAGGHFVNIASRVEPAGLDGLPFAGPETVLRMDDIVSVGAHAP